MEKQKLVTLVRNAQEGDSTALGELFAAYRNEVYSIAMQQTKNRTLSEDIVQETFLEVILKIDDLHQPASFPSWLKILAYHQCTRYYKKKETVHEVSAVENEDGFSVLDTLEETNGEFLPDVAVDQAEFRETILNMVNALPDAQRAALQMFYYEQMPLKVIAKVQGVSVNTANTRLNRGRLAVKNAVEDYEKKHGIRLHTIAFFPFFRWLLRGTKQVMPEESAALVARNIAAETGVALCGKMALSASSATATASAPTASTVSTKAAVAAGGKAASAGLATKLIAGVAAVSVAVGGAAVYQSGKKLPEEPTTAVVATQEIRNEEGANEETKSAAQYAAAPEDPAQDALACYETFLREGIAQGGFSISHYAILDIDRDGVPELIAADNDGTPETWTSCDLYTYQNDRLRYCGSTSAHYTFFYHVNNSYLLGSHRMGAQYFSPHDFFQTTIYHWNDAGDRNDPAICRNGGEWEYITQEEFEYYNSLTGGFVTESEIITLQENPYRQTAASGQFLDISKSWVDKGQINGHEYVYTRVFDETGEYYGIVESTNSNEYSGGYGRYNTVEDMIVFYTVSNGLPEYKVYSSEDNITFVEIALGGIPSYGYPNSFSLTQSSRSREEIKEMALTFAALDPDVAAIRSHDMSHKARPFFNKETEQTGLIGIDVYQKDNRTQFYFSCWIDGATSSAEEFLFEYQEGVTQYTVTGNRNKSAQYELMIDQQNAYVDITVKRITDEYQAIPEGSYRFYLTDYHKE